MSAEAAAPQVFTPRTVLVMVMVGVFAACAFLVLSTYAPELRAGRDGRAHALSRSAVGFAGLVQLAQEAGVPARVHRGGLEPGGSAGLRVLTPEARGDPAAFREAIDRDRPTVPTLVVLPKWLTAPDLVRPGWVVRAGRLDAAQAAAMFEASSRPPVAADTDEAPVRLTASPSAGFDAQDVDVGRVRGLQTISAPGYRPLLTDAQGRGVLVEAPGRSDLLILSDPDLLNTQGLADAARAQLALAMLDGLRGGGPVAFDVSINGFSGSRSLLKLAMEPPFLSATLCALAAAALMGWHAAARFGAARPSGRALALGKRALADNSAALLRMARREHRMAAPYAELTLQAAARAAGIPRGLDPLEATAMLDRLAARSGAPEAPSALAREAQDVADAGALMSLARRLYDLRRRMTRERD